jgi:TP901 family phage tail tape measure protein
MATAPVTVTANLNFNPASINAAGKQVQSAFGNINLPTKAANNFNNSLGRITGQASEFDKSINAATARVFAFGAAVSIINGISTAFKALVSSTIEVEKRLTEISSILGGSVQQLNQFKTAIFDVAKNTGQTFATVADGASELARQGLSAEETVKRLNAALILTRVSGLDAEGSVNALTSAINGFTSAGLTAEQIVNKLIAVDTAFAVSAKDLAEAFSRAGSTAEDAGVSFDELLGLVTSVQQTTARGGAVIGNAFKSIFSRLSRGTVIDDLQALGVEINASQTGVQKLQALSNALSKISDPTQANAIKELAGGVYQINVVSAALKDLSSETSIFGQASQTASQASNEAFEKNAQLNQTLASQINKLVQGLTELGSKIGELSIAPVIENLLTGANKLLDILNKVFDPEEGNKLIQGFFKGVGAFIAGPGLVLVSAAFFKLFQVVAKFAKEGISDLFKIGSEQERIKNIEGGIVALLQQDAKLRATLLSSSTSQAQKEQAVINSIKQQNALLAQQQALVNSIAVASAKAGVGGFTPSGGFSKKKGKGMFAAGYSANVSPYEAATEIAGASQHKEGYKAGKVNKGPIFDGRGSSFMGIWNDAETREDFINARGYKSTLIIPPNGFAARGFVPNFADETDPYPSRDIAWVEKQLLNKKNTQAQRLRLEQVLRIKKAKRQAQGDDEVTRLGSSQKPLDIQAKKYGYLIPKIGLNASNRNFLKGKGGPEPIDSWNSIKNIHFNLIGAELAGPIIEGIADGTNLDDTLSNDLSRSVMNKIVEDGVSFASKLVLPLNANPINEGAIIKRLLPKEQGGNTGLFGAVQGAAGAAFEAAVSEVVGINSSALKKGEADFDAQTIPEDLKKLFKLKNSRAADFKISTSPSSLSNFGKKILTKESSKYLRMLKPPKQNEEATVTRAASGFIPNFAALNDAISREMAAGIPRDKIYVDQNNSLKSSFNTEGLMVANRDDEPNGGKQGIRRAISEGKNPKTYGKANAARGFIPNYASGSGFLKLFSKIGKSADDVAGKLDKLGDGLQVTGKEGILKRGAKAVAQEGVTTAKFAAYSAVFGSLTLSADGLKGAFNDLVQFFNDSSDAIKEEASLRDSFVSQLQKEKAKSDPNESRVKDLEGLIKGSESQIKNLEEGSKSAAAAAFSFADTFFNAGDIIAGIGGKDGEKLLEKTLGKDQASKYTDKSEFDKVMGGYAGILTAVTGVKGFIANLVGTGLGKGAGYLQSQFGDSGAGGKYYNTGSWTDIEDRPKDYSDPTLQMRDNDVIGEFINRGYSLNEKERSGSFSFEDVGKSNFLVNTFEDKENTLNRRRKQTSDELVQAKDDLTLNPDRGEAEKRIQQLTSKLAKIDSDIESLDFKSFVNNFAKGVDARMAGESPLAKAIREAGGEGLNNREYAKATESNIEYSETQIRVKLEAAEIRKEIDRVKELFEKETVSFKFDVKNVRSQLERIIDDVSIGGSKASFERQGNITELQKRASNYQFGAFQNDSSLSVADQRYMAREAGSNNLKLDEKQFTRQDQLIQQKSADTFGDLFTKLTGNLNSSGSGTALLERERVMSDLSAAKGALAGSSTENQESAQQRVDQLTEKLSQIDSNIASRKDTAVDPTFEGEIQRARLQKIQGAASALTTGSKEEQQQALEDIFKDLEGLNLGGGGAEIKQEILDAAKEVSAERTAIFIDQEKTRLTNQLDVLEKEKSILDQFISDFNSSFAENIKGTRDNFNTLTKNQRPVAQNAAALTGARIGQGETTNTQIISDRLNAANRVTQTFDSANFSNLVGQEDLATFRSNTASQIVSGGKLTALEDINEKVAGNLRNTIDKAEFNDQETSSIKQVAKGSLEGVSSDILNRATGTGDTELAARAQELQDVLSDPEAGISQILTAVEGLNIDSSKLSEEVQTALQEQIAIALGTIGGQTRSVEGAGAVNESKDVSAQINDFSQSLSNLSAALDDNIPEVKFPEIVKTLESNTDLLQTAIGSLTTKFDGLDQASKGLEESLATFKKTVDSFAGNEDKDTEKLKAMADALEAVRVATKKLKPNTDPK